MFELTGRLSNIAISYSTGKPVLSVEVNEDRSTLFKMFDELKTAEKLSIKIGRFKKKRSLNANAYAWKIMTEIGNKTRQSKEDVYFLMLKRYGQSEMISVLAHIPIGEYVKYCEEAGESVLNGKQFKHYWVYKGSSEFDTKEMSIFIDGIVSEAKDLDIETATPNEIARMKDLWGE